jgi:methylglutaconyl-CoA hydratase
LTAKSFENIRLSWTPVDGSAQHVVGTLTLNRPSQANAFNAAMLDEIAAALDDVRNHKSARLLVLQAEGKHFSAGADLSWMQASAKLSFAENQNDALRLVRMFDALANLSIPTVAIVKGSAFGGAVGLAACCDTVIALEGAKFCLSEARLGILPGVIMPYLGRRMNTGALKRLMLTAKVFDHAEAVRSGLADLNCAEADLQKVLHDEINLYLQCGPTAQNEIKQLFRYLQSEGFPQDPRCVDAIARLRTGAEGQAGLAAFFQKQDPLWRSKINADWKLT